MLLKGLCDVICLLGKYNAGKNLARVGQNRRARAKVVKEVALGPMPLQLRHLENAQSLRHDGWNVGKELVPTPGIEMAAGVGIDEDVAVVHLGQRLKDDLGLPAPVAVAAHLGLQDVARSFPKGCVKARFIDNQRLCRVEAESFRLTPKSPQDAWAARVGKGDKPHVGN